MTVNRRQLFRSLVFTAGCSTAADGAEPAIPLEVLRAVSAVHGISLSDDRLRVVKPILEQHLPQLQTLREFEFDDTVEPTQGILDK